MRTRRLTMIPLLLAVALLALSQAGCATQSVEMPKGEKGRALAAATQKGKVAFAEARCFLYKRENYRPRSISEAWNESMTPAGLHGGVPAKAGSMPVLARTLVLGETFGFRRDAAGRLVAIAGEERIPLDEGRYAWELVVVRYTPEQDAARITLLLLLSGLRGPIT